MRGLAVHAPRAFVGLLLMVAAHAAACDAADVPIDAIVTDLAGTELARWPDGASANPCTGSWGPTLDGAWLWGTPYSMHDLQPPTRTTWDGRNATTLPGPRSGPSPSGGVLYRVEGTDATRVTPAGNETWSVPGLPPTVHGGWAMGVADGRLAAYDLAARAWVANVTLSSLGLPASTKPIQHDGEWMLLWLDNGDLAGFEVAALRLGPTITVQQGQDVVGVSGGKLWLRLVGERWPSLMAPDPMGTLGVDLGTGAQQPLHRADLVSAQGGHLLFAERAVVAGPLGSGRATSTGTSSSSSATGSSPTTTDQGAPTIGLSWVVIGLAVLGALQRSQRRT